MRSAHLFASVLLAVPVAAQQATPGGGQGAAPAPMTVQPLPGSTDADLLAAAMRRVGANANDLAALLDAGDLSVRVGDLSAAAAFYTRAERIDPRNGRAKAGEGAILVRAERPGEALRYFAMAESYGASVAALASDRAWAYDLLGENERAGRDYRFALKAHPGDADTVRRYALSLGIAGKQKLALDTLAPQIRAGDRTAWRDRAFIEAMGGDQAEAQRIATTMLPPAVSIGLLPFLRLLPSLGAADRAFAVHFGEVRATPERLADARLTPLLPALGADPDPPQVAVAAVVIPRPERGKRPKRGRVVQVAAREPVPEPAPPIPAYQGAAPGYAAAGYGVARGASAPVAVAVQMVAPFPSSPMTRAPVAPVRPAFVVPAEIAAASQHVFAIPPKTVMISPTPVPIAGILAPAIPPTRIASGPPVTRETVAAAAVSATVLPSASGQPFAAGPTMSATTATRSSPLPAGTTPSALSSITPQPSSAVAPIALDPAPVIAARSTTASPPLAAVPMAIGPMPITAVPPASGSGVAYAAPASTTLSAQTMPVEPVAAPVVVKPAESSAAPISALPVSTLLPSPTPPSSVLAAEPPPFSAPLATAAPLPPPTPSPALAQLVAALPIPGVELGVGHPAPPPAPVPVPDTADAAAAAQAALDQAARQAAAERVAKRAVAAKALADKRAAERKAAAEKQALADKKAAAEAKAEADRVAAAEKKAARANPSRIWVQVAGGASQGDLPDAWTEAKAKAPDVYAGHATGWTTPLRATNRVLAGPFKTDEEARGFVNALAKKGASGFTFTSKAGQAIAKLPKE